MRIEDILLTKQEIPITHETSFYLPIHPMLLDKRLKLEPKVAEDLFPQAVREWHAELSSHTEALPEGQTKKWYGNVFLKEGLKIMDGEGFAKFRLPFGWFSEVYPDERGFAGSLSVTRNSGSLYFNVEDRHSCSLELFEDSKYGILFTPEKLKEFSHKSYESNGRKSFSLHVYGKHNVDHFPAALLLRDWGILYLNEVMKQASAQIKDRTLCGGIDDPCGKKKNF